MKRITLVWIFSVALAGCSDPYAHRAPSVAPRVRRPAQSAGSPNAAARVFATRWINWDWRSAASQQRALAALAEGRLAAELRANAASARIDASLARDRPSVRGDIAVVSLSAVGMHASGLVVTRERTFTAGRPDLGGSHYRVYAVGLDHRGTRWEVSAWRPQP